MGAEGRRQAEVGISAGGWTAAAAVLWMLAVSGGEAGGWGRQTLAVAVVAAGLTALVAAESIRARRIPWYQRIPAVHIAGPVLGWVLWLLGGAYALLVRLIADHCGGTSGGSSFGCTHQTGPVLDLVGVALAVAPMAVLVLVARTGSRSRVVAWLAPALIVMLYALAVSLWQPH
jgi:hypothetical protein